MNQTRERVGPSPDANLKSKRIRARIIKGLVQLAGAEPVRTRGVEGGLPGLSDEDRRDLIGRILVELGAALRDLSDAIGPPGDPAGTTGTLHQVIGEATKTVARLSDEVHTAAPDRLEQFPEEARKPLSKLINAWWPLRKVFVAVHGIGDQFHNETVQSVAFRVCEYVGVPAALPLGRFHGGGATVTGAFLPDPDRDPPLDCGFAEIYWADVPRGPASEQHTLEEPTKWARVLVQRLRLRTIQGTTPSQDELEKMRRDDQRLVQLLEELIQGVVIADRLVFLAEQAGLFKFNLKKLLNDYLNDVQVVTEFEDYLAQLLGIFDEVLEKIHRYFDRTEIYIIAHSEGTVVAYMGLLKGLHEARPWTAMIKGLMTIGSPLNKHIRFWPELFNQFSPPANAPPHRIVWKNYYDFGDPIGYDLKPMREWMAGNGWDRFFQFENPRDRDRKAKDSGDDIGFTRYPFPGQAHNDYWKDPDVFGHFIEAVVESPDDATEPLLKRSRKEAFGVPTTDQFARVISYVLPYVLAAALLFLACYLLYKAARWALDPIGSRFETPTSILINVFGVASLIAGVSLLSRIPRLTKRWGWCWLALLSLGYLLVSTKNRASIEMYLTGPQGANTLVYGLIALALIALGAFLGWKAINLRPVLWTLTPVLGFIVALWLVGPSFLRIQPLPFEIPWSSIGVILTGWAMGLVAAYISYTYPRSGTKPLVHTGGLLIIFIIGFAIFGQLTLPVPDSARSTTAKALQDLQKATIEQIAAKHPDFQGLFDANGDLIPAERGGLSDMEWRKLNELAALQLVTDEALIRGPIWPLFLAGAAFLYIWWLAIVLFDLTFVWHLYIRHSAAQKYLDRAAHGA